MTAIVLEVLKIILICLLAILSIILAILLMVLFVPIRYKAVGAYDDKKFDFKVNASYLLHIISVDVFYEQGIVYKIKLFGICIFNSKKPKKTRKKKNKKSTNKEKAVKKSESDISEKVEAVNKIESIPDDSPDKTADAKTSKPDSDSESVNVDTKNKKTNDDVKINDKKIEDKAVGSDKKESAMKKFSSFKEFITSDRTQEAIKLCVNRIGKLIKAILPRKGFIEAHIGLENAGITGKIMGIYYTFLGLWGRVLHIYPYYDEQILKGRFKIKGKIVIFTILYQLIRIYFDKNCHKIIKDFLKKN